MNKIEIHPITPEKRYMQEIAKEFRNGKLFIFPCDTGYVMGCNIHAKKALKKLYHLKKPDKKYQMAVAYHDFSQISNYALVDNWAYKYMRSLLPGPFTFILPASNLGRKVLEVKRTEMGVRIPETTFMNSLRNFFTDPIILTTPKQELDEEFNSPDEIDPLFLNAVDMVIDMGILAQEPTTIISLMEDQPTLLRMGSGIIEEGI